MRLYAEASEDAAAAAAAPPERAPTFERLVWEEARRLLAAVGDWGSRPLDELLERLCARGCDADEATVVAVCIALLTSPSICRMVFVDSHECSLWKVFVHSHECEGACCRATLVTTEDYVLTEVSRGTEEGAPALTGA